MCSVCCLCSMAISMHESNPAVVIPHGSVGLWDKKILFFQTILEGLIRKIDHDCRQKWVQHNDDIVNAY